MDLSPWETLYDVIYKRHVEAGRYPADAMLAISTKSAKSWTQGKPVWETWRFPLDNPLAAGKKAAWLDSRDLPVYFRITPVSRDYPTEYVGADGKNKKGVYTRGPAADSLGVPCLYLDMDTADGEHKPFASGLPHPTTAQVIKLLDDLLPPSVLIKSGGGLHAYWALDTIITVPLNSAGTPDRQSSVFQILKRFDDWIVTEAAKRGFGMDTGLAADLARVLRMPESRNFKADETKTVKLLRVDHNLSYSLGALLHKVPAAAVNISARRAAASNGVTPLRPAGTPVPGSRPVGFKAADYKATDAFSAAVPASYLMEGVWEMETDSADDAQDKIYYFPRADGTVSREQKSAVTYMLEGGSEIAYAHSTRLHEEWGVGDFHTPVNSWNLVNVCTNGNTSLSRTLIKVYPEPTEELLDVLRTLNARRHAAAERKAA